MAFLALKSRQNAPLGASFRIRDNGNGGSVVAVEKSAKKRQKTSKTRQKTSKNIKNVKKHKNIEKAFL
jgi:hypothetical protein